jgi:hypothetical protein
MITAKFVLADGKKEVYHFKSMVNFNTWFNLYAKRFKSLDISNSKAPRDKMVFGSRLQFDSFYEQNLKAFEKEHAKR